MKYTLAQNAVSSLSIAIDNFKKFYYFTNDHVQSEIEEAIKICIIFLENAIELMLKDILVSTDPLSIYMYPDSKTVQNALKRVTPSCKLEDILISEGNFKTIGYEETVKKYNEEYHNSQKLYRILMLLGTKRNAITHFGIDETDGLDELIISILNTFDVIYNYLYPQLIQLDAIGDYFICDDLFVDTVHGPKALFDKDSFVYNNILDFLDELMEESKEYSCRLRASNPQSKISEFTQLLDNLIDDYKFKKLLADYNVNINFTTYCCSQNNFCFEVVQNSEVLEIIMSCYSPYFNVTAFCNECGVVNFLVAHSTHKLYIYNQGEQTIWPESDEAEPDSLWLTDFSRGVCQEVNLSKRNLLSAFECVIKGTVIV